MAATFAWVQRTGAGAGSEASLGISGNLFNFMKKDSATAADYSTNPIPAGENSFEVYLRAKFTGTFNKIEKIQFWRSTNFSPATGLSLYWKPKGASAYVAPTSAVSRAISAIPTSDPTTANVGIGNNITGNLAASGYSNHIVLQLRTTSAAPAGDSSLCTLSLNYDES